MLWGRAAGRAALGDGGVTTLAKRKNKNGLTEAAEAMTSAEAPAPSEAPEPAPHLAPQAVPAALATPTPAGPVAAVPVNGGTAAPTAAAVVAPKRRGWLVMDIFAEARAIGRMFVDPRYHLSWPARIIVLVLI